MNKAKWIKGEREMTDKVCTVEASAIIAVTVIFQVCNQPNRPTFLTCFYYNLLAAEQSLKTS